MRWTCHVKRKAYVIKKHNVFTLGDLEGGDHLQGLGVDGSQYKSDLKNGIWKMRTGFILLRTGIIMGSWWYGKGASSSIKDGEILD
jgi:hypothetical protein